MFDDNFFEKVHKKRIAVIGDVMLDKFYYADMKKFSSDAPIPVARVNERKASPGGAANVARCLANLGCSPILLGFVGNDHNRESLIELLDDCNINYSGLLTTTLHTTTKVRIISKNHQVFRLDFDDDAHYSDELFESLASHFHDIINRSLDAVVLADYEKGVLDERFCQFIIKECSNHGTPVIILPYGSNWIKYENADFITPNIAKMNRVLLAPIEASDDDACLAAAHYIRRKFNIKTCLETRSSYGITLASANMSKHFPTKSQLLIDLAGAADAVAAAATLALAAGLTAAAAAALANIAAGIVVSQPGSYAPTQQDILNSISDVI